MNTLGKIVVAGLTLAVGAGALGGGMVLGEKHTENKLEIVVEAKDDQIKDLQDLLSSQSGKTEEYVDFSSLPSHDLGRINSQKLKNGDYLFSFKNLEGVYFYDHETKRFEQKYATDKGWEYFNEVEGGCLIGSQKSDLEGLLFFDNETKSISKIYEGGKGLFRFENVKGGCLISGAALNSGIHYFDNATKQVVQKHSTGDNWQFKSVAEGALAVGSEGVYYFDNTTKELTQKSEEGHTYPNFIDVKGGLLISGGGKGILFFDASTKEVSQKFSQGTNFVKVCDVDNITFVMAADCNGIIYFDGDTKEITQAETSVTAYVSICNVEGGHLFGELLGSILYFDKEAKTFTQKYTSFASPKYSGEVEGGVLIGSDTTNGILFFDNESKEITLKYEEGNRWGYFQKVEGGCLILSQDFVAQNILYFDNATKEITKKDDKVRVSESIPPLEVNGGVLIYDYDKYAINLYKDEDKSITKFTLDPDNYNVSRNERGVTFEGDNGVEYLYDETTMTVKLLYSKSFVA